MSRLLNLFSSTTAKAEALTPSKDLGDQKLAANLPGGVDALSLRGQSERTNISCIAQKGLHVSCNITAAQEAGNDDKRLPVEIAIALDVSGSMGGNKIELCKDTLNLILKYLLPKDKISITTFDTDVTRCFDLLPMNDRNKQRYESTVKKVRAGSATNLSGGLMDAISILKRSETKGNIVKACILLTDGHANNGIRDMGKLAKIVKQELAGTAISLFTYGYGADHNVNALQKLSQASDGGSYYFVDKEDNISSAIGDCLGGIMSVVAQNIVLEAKAVDSGVSITNCYEESREVNISKDGTYTIKFGDLYAGERRDTIFAIDVDPARGPAAHVPLVRFKIKYLDAMNECIKECEATCEIDRLEDNEVDPTKTNQSVSMQVARVVVAKALSEANKHADKHELKEGKQILMKGIAYAKSMESKVDDKQALEALIQDLHDAMQAMKTQHSWRGAAGYSTKSKAMMHMQQRCNESNEMAYNSYRTARKSAVSHSMKARIKKF